MLEKELKKTKDNYTVTVKETDENGQILHQSQLKVDKNGLRIST